MPKEGIIKIDVQIYDEVDSIAIKCPQPKFKVEIDDAARLAFDKVLTNVYRKLGWL